MPITSFILEAEEGGKTLTDDAFLFGLKALLTTATKHKILPKSGETRHWAVVATDLEKVLAYVNTYLKEF